ncbi:hypothetical protein U8Q05_05760 [Rhizobium ruizarguesonis]|nr:hypothetical protein U8Q05_05760 [Rhizobium ruizarguesonis]
MRQRLAIRLLTSAALAAVLSLGGVGGVNAEDAAKADDAGTAAHFDADSVTTFSGAFLAARTADVDHDYETAIELYKKALQIEPGNPEISPAADDLAAAQWRHQGGRQIRQRPQGRSFR